MSKTARYVLTQDNDGHWYAVPALRLGLWNDWLSLDSDDEASWEPPDYAISIGGSPSLLSFTDPRIER